MKNLNRREFIKLAGTMTTLAALNACAGNPPTPTPGTSNQALPPPTNAPAPTAVPPTATTAAPKVLRLRLYGDIQNLDPAFRVSANDDTVAVGVLSGLVVYNPGTYNIVNDLAESYSTSADGKEVTFKIRQGVKWQNGYGELTTDDVKFSFERYVDKNLKADYADDWAALDHVEIVDAYNCKLVFKEPFAPLWHSTLPVGSGWIICKKYYNEVGKDKFATSIMGSGPYLYADWKPKQEVLLKRNPDFYGTPAAYDEIHLIPIEDDKAAEVALEAGELDFSRISADSFDRFASNPKFKTVKLPSLRYRWIGMDAENPKLQDINVRQAIRYAIDVPSIVKATYMGQADPEYALIAPGLVGYWKDAPHYTRDVAKAKDFMAKAGITSLDLRMDIQNTSEYKSWAEIAQQNLKDIGINLTINPMDSSSFWSIGDGDKGKQVELFADNYSMEPDPSWCTMWFTTDQIGIWNWMRWSSPEYDSLHKQGLTTLDDKAREQIYLKMQQLMDDAAIAVWITNGTMTYAYTPAVEPALSPHGLIQTNFFKPAQV
jgi:peptide/nickel transport system substrate-binding protein